MKNIYNFLILLLGSYLWMSNSSGHAAAGNGNATTKGCGASPTCHQGANFKSKATILISKNNEIVSEYVPEENYDVAFIVEKSEGIGSPAAYGFQLTAISGGNSAGTFSDFIPENDIQISTLNGRTFVEHSQKAASGNFKMQWKAPSKGRGTINFLGAGNAVNNDNNILGDAPTPTIALSLNEKKSITTNEISDWENDIKIVINASEEIAYLNFSTNSEMNSEISLFNFNGQIFYKSQEKFNVGKNYIPLKINDLPKGIYIILIESKSKLYFKKFVIN